MAPARPTSVAVRRQKPQDIAELTYHCRFGLPSWKIRWRLAVGPLFLRCPFDSLRGDMRLHRGSIEGLSKLLRSLHDGTPKEERPLPLRHDFGRLRLIERVFPSGDDQRCDAVADEVRDRPGL